MVGKNQRKLEVLQFVKVETETTANQVARELEIEISNSKKLLARYWQMNLLRRRLVNKKTRERAYSITQKGLDRIEWLNKNRK